jgi:hypothetical protein
MAARIKETARFIIGMLLQVDSGASMDGAGVSAQAFTLFF